MQCMIHAYFAKKQIVFFWKELQFARWLTCNFIQLKLIWKEVWKFVIQDSIGRWYNHLSREVKAPFVVPVCNFLPWQRRGLWDTRENWKFSKEWQAFFSIPSPQTGKTELGIFLEQAKFPPVYLRPDFALIMVLRLFCSQVYCYQSNSLFIFHLLRQNVPSTMCNNIVHTYFCGRFSFHNFA